MMPSEPLAPIAYEQMRDHLDCGGFLQLPNDDFLSQDLRGQIIGKSMLNSLLYTATLRLDSMVSDEDLQDVQDVSLCSAELLGLTHLSENALLENQTKNWERALEIFTALSRAKFVCSPEN